MFVWGGSDGGGGDGMREGNEIEGLGDWVCLESGYAGHSWDGVRRVRERLVQS